MQYLIPTVDKEKVARAFQLYIEKRWLELQKCKDDLNWKEWELLREKIRSKNDH